MHHVVNKARRTERYRPEAACESCLHYYRNACGMGRVHWPTAGRRCKRYEMKGRTLDDE